MVDWSRRAEELKILLKLKGNAHTDLMGNKCVRVKYGLLRCCRHSSAGDLRTEPKGSWISFVLFLQRDPASHVMGENVIKRRVIRSKVPIALNTTGQKMSVKPPTCVPVFGTRLSLRYNLWSWQFWRSPSNLQSVSFMVIEEKHRKNPAKSQAELNACKGWKSHSSYAHMEGGK